VASGDVASAFHEPIVLDLARERTRDGSVHFHVTYPEAEETIPCESLRAALSLPSCPSHLEHRNGSWTFEGIGQGHGLGLDVERARELSREGATPLAILRSAYATAEDLH
jgi:peptidoglycan hydrolase-like amidase